MSGAFLTKKMPIVFFLLFSFVISLNSAEAGRSILLRKVKTHLAPRHISLSVRSGNGMYARTYAYGRPMASYSTKGKVAMNRRYYAGRGRSGRRTYASMYRNWSPQKNLRTDRVGQLKKRKELLPFLSEPPYGPKHKRRARPHRPSPMQRPKPPKKPSEFDDDYFFPEEAKRAETKYEFESRYPRPKKKRRPEFESNYKSPGLASKIPYYDEKPLPYKTKSREPSFSYSSFVQHPSASSDDPDDFYEDPDSVYSQPVVRNKKKRVKKKSNKKKNKDHYKPFVFQNDPTPDNYPPYHDDYEPHTPKTYNKRNKPSYDPPDDDDDFLPTKPYAKPRPQLNTLFSTDSDYRASQNTQQLHFNPAYSQTWSQPSPLPTTPRPLQYQTESGFQPQQYVPNHYNYNKDYSTAHNTKTATNTQQSYYSPPDNTYKTLTYSSNYAPSQAAQPQTPTNYNTYSATYNQPSPTYSPTHNHPSPTYSQPLPSPSVLTDVTIQKSVPLYDNTETFYNFNNNAYVSSHSSKYYNPDGTQKYGTRLTTSHRNKPGEKADSDSDFMKKHQNLYNNGLSGVPVQGDGYAKESGKKDYDIGYGDFQFDENPTT